MSMAVGGGQRTTDCTFFTIGRYRLMGQIKYRIRTQLLGTDSAEVKKLSSFGLKLYIHSFALPCPVPETLTMLFLKLIIRSSASPDTAGVDCHEVLLIQFLI